MSSYDEATAEIMGSPSTKELCHRALRVFIDVKEYYTYIVSNQSNTVLYTGMTNDLEKRLIQHRSGKGSGFTAKYNCHKLLWYESFPSAFEAIRLEKRIKKWKRKWKEDLIRSDNPTFKDLADETDSL